MHDADGARRGLAAWFAGLERRCVAIGQRVAFIGVIGILLVAVLMALDVVLRATLNISISGLNEVVALVLAVAVAACLPAGVARRIGLDIDIISRWLSPSTLEWLKILGHFVLLAFLSVLSWRFALFTLGVERNNLGTIILGWPQAPFLWAVTGLLVVCIPFQAVVAGAAVSAACRTSRGAVAALVAALACFIAVWAAFAFVPGAAVLNLLPESRPGLAIWFFCALWIAILLLIPLGPALGFAGLLGTAALLGLEPALTVLGSETHKYLTYQSLATLPLFLLMGSFASVAGLSSDVYVLANALFRHRRGGLAMATIGGCAGFGALTGSSLATAVTIGKIALPEMRQRGYADSLATGCVAAGGTLGQIVPPSTAIIIFAILTEESIGKLFIAAIGPAIVAVTLYLLTVSIVVRFDPKAAPEPERRDWSVIGPALLRCWGVFLLFGLVMGGIYGGMFTETEAAAVGAVGAFLFALLRGKLSRGAIWEVMAETTGTIAMIYILIFGAVMFSFFIGVTQLPTILGSQVEQWNLAPILVVMIFVVVYLVLGTVMESFAMMVITVPVFAPIISDLGYSLVWWGIVTVICVETGMISPPFGLNLFVLKSIAPNVPLTTVYRGVLPFVAADCIRVALLVAFPIITLWLPRWM